MAEAKLASNNSWLMLSLIKKLSFNDFVLERIYNLMFTMNK